MSDKKQKRFCAKHAKSSAVAISLAIHAILLLIAVSLVVFSVVQKEERQFEAKVNKRPTQKLRKPKVPIKTKQSNPKPKLRQRIVVKDISRRTPKFNMPEIKGVKGGLGSLGDGLGVVGSIGFTLPEINFFDAEAKGEKICFVVHFGVDTLRAEGQAGASPFSRMTALTIRNRLEDVIAGLPDYALFNVIAYWAQDAWAMSPNMMLATPANKERVVDWMEPVNPLEGEYSHCFGGLDKSIRNRIDEAKRKWPTRVGDGLPFFTPKWVYPYTVPKSIEMKYVPDAHKGITHWGRGVAWAILEQKADTVFVLTTNYSDGWKSSEPRRMAQAFAQIMLDSYGPDRKTWPTVNVVVLAKVGRDPSRAYNVLNNEFSPILKAFKSEGSVIEDIKDFMNKEEEELYYTYKSEYGAGGN